MSKGVVSDAGHGGHDAGAINGLTGHRESDIVLDFSQKFCRHFKRLTGIEATQTRNSDVFVTLSGRAEIANENGLPLISWHCNAFNAKAKGVEAFTSPGQTSSDPLATEMLEAYVAANPTVARRFDRSDGDPDKEARFTVLTKTNGPAVLFELGFIDSPEDIRFLSNDIWRDENAEIQAQVVAGHFGLLEDDSPSLVEPETPKPEPNKIALKNAVNSLIWQANKIKDLIK